MTSPYMPLYIADYMADAAHLTTEEHGAYLLLIMTYWQRAKPLDNTSERLANVVRLSSERWADVKHTLSDFFEIDGNIWVHKRIERELERFKVKSVKAKHAAKASVIKRKISTRSTDAQRTLNHTDTDTDTSNNNNNTTIGKTNHAVLSDFFKKCNEYILGKFPDMITRDKSPIIQWEAMQADFDRHVKPTIDTVHMQGKIPSTLSYFTPIVKQFMDGLQQEKTSYSSPEEIFKRLNQG